MGGGSAAAALWIRTRLPFGSGRDAADVGAGVAADHWTYGRWAVGTGLLGGVMLNLYYLVLPVSHGLDSAARLKALTNLVMPAMQSFFALSVITVPVLVRVRNTPSFGRTLRRLILLYAAGALAYWLAIGVGNEYVVQWLYGGRYRAESHLLWILGLVPFTSAGISIFESALRSLERSDDVCRAYVWAVIVTAGVGLPSTLAWGTAGAIVGLLVSASVAVCALAFSLRSRMSAAGQTGDAGARLG
jgi:O-antigen/teichoic acid export membrane protein